MVDANALLTAAAQNLPSSTPTILSNAVTQLLATPQSPVPVQGAQPLAVATGGAAPVAAPKSKKALYAGIGIGSIALIGLAWWVMRRKKKSASSASSTPAAPAAAPTATNPRRRRHRRR